MPEYNHNFPGELKMMLDMLFNEYDNKRVAVCGVSSGPLGGARGAQALILALNGMQLLPIYPAVYFANVQQLFDEHGAIKDPSYEKRVSDLINALKASMEK